MKQHLNTQNLSFAPTPQGLFKPTKGFFGFYSPIGVSEAFTPGPNRLALSPPLVQAKSLINLPNDRYEREANRMADQVMRMPEPSLQRQVDEDEEEKKEDQTLVQMKPVPGRSPQLPPSVRAHIHALKGKGHALPSSVRTFFEPRFGHDFSRVRVHADAKAAESARMINARAYTVGRHVIFGAGQYAPYSGVGKRLLAHELTHTLQQEGAGSQASGTGRVQRLTATLSRIGVPFVQRQPCPTGVNFNIDPHPAHVPACGNQLVRARAQPANIPNLTWSLRDGSATVNAGTSINAQGEITIAAGQDAGNINVRATRPAAGANPACWFDMLLAIRSHPTGISQTRVVGPPPNPAQNYGGTFDHVFNSHDGNVASLQNVAVGERFPNVPNPNGAVHNNIPTPFGPFNLRTKTLTPNANNNWFLTAAGELGGTHDRVTFGKAGVNVGRFLQSASNPNPAHALPVSFSLAQDLHWYCRTAAAANRWTQFVQIQHTRGLRQNAGAVQFFTQVNGQERAEAYTGHPGIINARAVPNRVARSPAGGPANTVTVRADTLPDPLPAGHALRFSIRGNARGSAVDANTGIFSAGRVAGQVRVRIRDSQAANPNHDETTVNVV